ncbi:MAG: L-lactate permease [Gemmatimonadetes bacterium]|nr:L-lactate permease [Gemmatimonadota bacterium]
MTLWAQRYDPLGSPLLSTLAALAPIVVLLGLLATHRVRAHWAALAGLAASLTVAVGVIGMPAPMAARAAALGAAYGLFPIGWIVLNVIFLYRLSVEQGAFDALQRSITHLTADRRLQLVLIAFSFGAFFEGAAGFSTPVAVTAALLIGLGFAPLEASGLSLIANTAPVAFGALGTPLVALQGVTGLDLHALSAMVGRQLPLFSLIIPFWLIAVYDGWRGVREVWPALLVAGVAFAVPQYLVATYHGPWLVDVVAAVCSMVALALFLRVWHPAATADRALAKGERPSRAELVRAWTPWTLLSVVVFAWGTPQVKGWLNGISSPALPVPGLHDLVLRVPPVVAAAHAEAAVFSFNWLSATGSGIALAAVLAGLALGVRPARMVRAYGETLVRVAPSLLTIAAMLALGYVTRYSGSDTILGLAFAHTGWLYPFFGTMLGWLGVALTGSDTSSNVLFGSLQVVTAQQVGVSPVLMAAANSAGGVMGKMIDAQSIVVAGTATHTRGQEGAILRYVFKHSLALASLVGLWVMAQAYIFRIR